jgi:cell division protein FtsQ
MPLSDKMSVRVPVFTDFPEKKIYTAKDSLLLNDVKKMAGFILNDPFWMSQVAQIDINADGNPMAMGFEMIPVVGNHLVKLGNGNDIGKKFNRLMTFYKEVLSKTGFDVYSTVDVQYAGQVVGTKRGTEKKMVDLAKLQMNVDNLLKQMQQAQNDTVTASQPITEKPTIDEKQVQENSKSLRATSPQPTNPNTLKTESLPQKNENKPKAMMPKKN